MSDSALKAYVVHDGDEQSVIAFGKTNAHARRIGAAMMDTDFDSIDYCQRSKGFDRYAPGPVPKIALIDAGWWFECYGCGRAFDRDEYRYGYSYNCPDDEEETDRHPIPVEHGHGIWCTEECYLADRADRHRRFKAEAEAREAMAGLVVHRYPGAIITDEHAYVVMIDGWYQPSQVRIRFSWPGCRYGDACLYLEDGNTQDIHITVPAGDREAWIAWREAGHPITGVGREA